MNWSAQIWQLFGLGFFEKTTNPVLNLIEVLRSIFLKVQGKFLERTSRTFMPCSHQNVNYVSIFKGNWTSFCVLLFVVLVGLKYSTFFMLSKICYCLECCFHVSILTTVMHFMSMFRLRLSAKMLASRYFARAIPLFSSLILVSWS